MPNDKLISLERIARFRASWWHLSDPSWGMLLDTAEEAHRLQTRIEKLEEVAETEHGYRQGQADTITTLMADLKAIRASLEQHKTCIRDAHRFLSDTIPLALMNAGGPPYSVTFSKRAFDELNEIVSRSKEICK